ncbi:MAG: hypothetical protein Q7S40_25360 [Opitutaceae bacterium]|nr:hypothetical protein [Opitutaceae bacterium]
MNLRRLAFALLVVMGAVASGRAASAAGGLAVIDASTDFRRLRWSIDPRPVLTRGGEGSIDRGVVGDPCIVWDDELDTWRMFYFANGHHPHTGARGPRTAMALAASAEQIGPGDWRKVGLLGFTNPAALINPNDYHKWWVVMDAGRPNRASRIEEKYWAVFTASKRMPGGRMQKHIQAAHAEKLAGPWTLLAQPIIAPEPGRLDSLHADTPSAFWFTDRKQIAIFYKGYPIEGQATQPGSAFGSGTLVAAWNPSEPRARNVRVVMRAAQGRGWNQGWMSSIQLLGGPTLGWFGLHNGSPTPPADQSHREPAPSLGGWVVCDGDPFEGSWRPDGSSSPFVYPDKLTPPENAAGLGVNFWRHHLLVTPQGNARIFFNSGSYGAEQMYSLVPP